MKRNIFVKSCLSVGTFLSGAVSLMAATVSTFRTNKGFKINSGKDRYDRNLTPFDGDTFFTKISSKDTDGDLFIFESTRVKEGGPPHHIHPHQDEWWYILEGDFLIKVGDVTYEAKAGDSVFGPRAIPHSFAKAGNGVGKLLITFQPAGKMEEFFEKLSAGVTKNMTPEERTKFSTDHGITRVGPPIKQLKQ
jgi:mannose-6-phosphate isomerase-like protein (cupin superfamily)